MKLNKLAKELNISCDQEIEITALNTLSDATSHELTFLENKKYVSELQYTKAAAVFVKEEFKNMVPSGTVALVCDEPYVALAHASAYFAAKVVELEGKDAQIGKDTTIMPNVNIGKNVVIGDNFTMGVKDAVLASDFLACNRVLGYHYDTFGYIEIDKPKAKAKFDSQLKSLKLLNIGESMMVK